jgi:DnaJ-class molecular chaperone|tara:strand:+ start:295 stop:435 length:141 start_codon:yes stop_codon:yes gene_type:complete
MSTPITPETVHVIAGEGMPIFQSATEPRKATIAKGNLYLKFDIQFP